MSLWSGMKIQRFFLQQVRATGPAAVTVASAETRQPGAPVAREAFPLGTLSWAPATQSLEDVNSIYEALPIRWAPTESSTALPPPSTQGMSSDAEGAAALTSSTSAVSAPATLSEATADDGLQAAVLPKSLIIGPVPLPRSRPTLASLPQPERVPLPRRRPMGSAPPSVFAPIATNDDRYPGQ